MTDSLIVARALLRLGPFARAVSSEHGGRSAGELLEQRRQRAAQPRRTRSEDPWHTGAARAAFTIWATEPARATDSPADRTRR
jgi:hypothetical protein